MSGALVVGLLREGFAYPRAGLSELATPEGLPSGLLRRGWRG